MEQLQKNNASFLFLQNSELIEQIFNLFDISRILSPSCV